MTRGKPREDAVLAATRAMLAERGYVATTIDAIAAEAHASKATIYRRWPNKPALVRAALDALDAGTTSEIPDSGHLRADLLAAMAALREQATAPYIAMMTDLVAASRNDAALAEALRAHVDDEEISPIEVVLRRARRRGQVRRGLDCSLLHDVVEALVLRQIQRALPFDDVFIRRVVDRVVLPLVEAPARPSRSRA